MQQYPDDGSAITISEPTYTQIPNAILDNLHRLSLPESCLLMVLCRLTFGWHRQSAQITLPALSELSGISRSTVCTAMDGLIDKGLVAKNVKTDPFSYTITVRETDRPGNGCVRETDGGRPGNGRTPVRETDAPLYKERIKERSKERGKFQKPTIDEIRTYMLELEWEEGNPNKFFDYYESNGWRVGKNPMKDWKATVRQWKSREIEARPPKPWE